LAFLQKLKAHGRNAPEEQLNALAAEFKEFHMKELIEVVNESLKEEEKQREFSLQGLLKQVISVLMLIGLVTMGYQKLNQ